MKICDIQINSSTHTGEFSLLNAPPPPQQKKRKKLSFMKTSESAPSIYEGITLRKSRMTRDVMDTTPTRVCLKVYFIVALPHETGINKQRDKI